MKNKEDRDVKYKFTVMEVKDLVLTCFRSDIAKMFQKLLTMRNENKNLFAEIANFVALLEEMGVSSYKLTGSLQDPIIMSYTLEL